MNAELTTAAFAIIHPDGRITDQIDGPPIGVVMPSSAFNGCQIICLRRDLVAVCHEVMSS